MDNEEISVDIIGNDDENSENSGNEGPSHPKKSRSSFTIRKKIDVIEYRRKHSERETCEHFKICRNNVQRWIKQEIQLRDVWEKTSKTNQRKQLDGSGRPLRDKNFDEELIGWIRNRRAGKQRVSRRMIQEQALKMMETEEDQNPFKASSGWLNKFLLRHHLSNRKPTTVCQKPPEEYAATVIKFILFIRRMRNTKHYHHIYAADETAVWLDSGGSTVDRTGAKDVYVLTTGQDKLRITVMLTARSDGYKCLPFVLLNRKRPIPAIVNAFKNRLHLVWSGKTWMDDTLTEQYLLSVFGHGGHYFNRLLVWDAFRCHISNSTKNVLKKIKLEIAVVPGGCTKFVQPADVVWNAPFKAFFRQHYEDWMLHGEKETTPAGNPRAPPMMEYLRWLANAWESLPQETIAKSFKQCGITNAVDGTEDDQIHCFKAEGPIPDGLQLLSTQRMMEEVYEQFNEIDLLQDAENDFLSDESIEF